MTSYSSFSFMNCYFRSMWGEKYVYRDQLLRLRKWVNFFQTLRTENGLNCIWDNRAWSEIHLVFSAAPEVREVFSASSETHEDFSASPEVWQVFLFHLSHILRPKTTYRTEWGYQDSSIAADEVEYTASSPSFLWSVIRCSGLPLPPTHL